MLRSSLTLIMDLIRKIFYLFRYVGKIKLLHGIFEKNNNQILGI